LKQLVREDQWRQASKLAISSWAAQPVRADDGTIKNQRPNWRPVETGRPMQLTFFEHPIMNPPYAYPARHWELDADGQPTNKLIESRRRSDLITPVPKAKKHKAPKGPTAQVDLELTADDEGLSTAEQKYDPTPIISERRGYADIWRALPTQTASAAT